ncbi:hypothetical protein OZX67_00515 [Bifidobacterium sp. ESL0728]|uniref:hypothetical protein n=1 Tax=Bifidobacterium sp. ESL0728 TaxID=2983220 RepID=UPI0023F7D86C|nr:hypothetical protein [Bifidobacterium sp. ESL0728]WEV59102.1 hypothetical protein OZX67_00515 [Bifidobacterium sp. ESL0728]
MNKKKKLSAIVGAVVSAATLLAFAPFGVANAGPATGGDNDGSTPLTLVDPGANVGATIKVMASPKYISGHTFAAVRVGTYKAASADSSSLTGFVLDTDPGVLTGSKTALNSISSFQHDNNYSLNNPVGELASKYLGFTPTDNSMNKDTTSYDPTVPDNKTSMWAGGVRQFVTTLTQQTDFVARQQAAAANANTPNSGMTAPVNNTSSSFEVPVGEPGLYVIEDVTGGSTNGGTNSIPMLVGTAVYSDLGSGSTKAYTAVANGGQLGQVSMKNDLPTVTKERVDKKPLGADGGYIHYYIKTQVPLTTGFQHYVFNVQDDSTTPLTYVNDGNHKTKVFVKNVDVDNDAEIPSNSYNITNSDIDSTEVTGMPSTNYAHRIVFNFYDTFVGHYTHGDPIVISYWMKYDLNGDRNNVKNKAMLEYSDDVNNQANMMGNGNANNAPNNGHTSGSGSATSNNGNNSNGTSGSISVVDNTLYGVSLLNKLYGDDGAKLVGSEFRLFRSDDLTTPLHFAADPSNPGVYSLSTKPADTLTNLTPAASGDNLGKIQLKDLDGGDYVVKQVKGATNVRNLFLPQFTLTVGSDAAGAPFVKNGGDNWNLNLVTASNNATNGTVTVNNVAAISQLPLTGSAGIALIVLAVVALSMVAAGTTVLKRRHNAARQAK